MLDRYVCASQNRRFAIIFLLAFGILFVMSPGARASFIGPYALSNFTLTNVHGDGSYSSPDGTETLILTGPNLGDGFPGFTDLTITLLEAGLVQFDWSYASLDTPTFDFAGYAVNNNFNPLADTDGEFGSVSFTANAGDIFAFRAATADNTGEPGVLTVTNFSGPGSVSDSGNAVPEPATAPVLTGILGAALIARKVVRRRKEAGI